MSFTDLRCYTGSKQARKYHSITFIPKDSTSLYDKLCSLATNSLPNPERAFYNTWDAWHLIPTSRPVVNPPQEKTSILEIPGTSDIIDLSHSLTSFPTYGLRTGSWSFYAENGFKEWDMLYTEILNSLDGKRVLVSLNDEIQYTYEGRVWVSGWTSDRYRSTITISYEFKPYKTYIFGSTNDILWNLFNFQTGCLLRGMFSTITVNRPITSTMTESNSDVITFTSDHVQTILPVNPIFEVAPSLPTGETTRPGIAVCLKNSENTYYPNAVATFGNGASSDSAVKYDSPAFIISGINKGNQMKFLLQGYGTISIEFYGRRL